MWRLLLLSIIATNSFGMHCLPSLKKAYDLLDGKEKGELSSMIMLLKNETYRKAGQFEVTNHAWQVAQELRVNLSSEKVRFRYIDTADDAQKNCIEICIENSTYMMPLEQFSATICNWSLEDETGDFGGGFSKYHEE